MQFNGKQVLLARGKANKAEAMAPFHKLMLVGTAAIAEQSLPIATLCDLFLDYSEAHYSPRGFKNYKYFLQVFCKAHGNMNAGDIKPFHVNRWVDGKKRWNGAKRHAIVSVKRVYSWAEQQGLIQVNPLRLLKAPRANRRERVLTAEEVQTRTRSIHGTRAIRRTSIGRVIVIERSALQHKNLPLLEDAALIAK